MRKKIDEKTLDHIVEEMVSMVENSKDEIFNIGEEARREHENLLLELQDTKEKVSHHIDNGDKLEQQVKSFKKRLSVVSKHFDRYSEAEIQEVYVNTNDMQTKLAVLRQDEKVLRKRRDELERRLVMLNQTIERAESLASKISVILTYLHDDFKQVNEIIAEAKEKQEFGLKIIEAQEDERKRISREIHDGPAQMLANILLRSEIVERSFKQGTMDKTLTEIKSVRRMIRSSLYEVRRIIYDLRPMALDDLGLLPTIKKYVATVASYHESIKIEFIPYGEEKRLPQEYEVALFRLIQESLQNAVKHAKATRIKVKLEIGKNNLTVIVSDNGIGFDPDSIKDKSFGLIGMRERVEMLEGRLSITSSEEGTKVFITVPYNAPFSNS
ncbi:sensor histidine kinase [Virgibacillus alimentarius]|uniref:Signal transduction histidine-protein kinase/phosphatase DegS n=1 Tax=Virgibacillus alimentarius TaxID=698769 RepID=A0ABS4S5L1_9BACI|nr:sensor histidine kinase [Virgibacillus alimentarius]MBP2256783.1 two-component system sensor histidine kinase DegS [Virgibacillus alimentarius]